MKLNRPVKSAGEIKSAAQLHLLSHDLSHGHEIIVFFIGRIVGRIIGRTVGRVIGRVIGRSTVDDHR